MIRWRWTRPGGNVALGQQIIMWTWGNAYPGAIITPASTLSRVHVNRPLGFKHSHLWHWISELYDHLNVHISKTRKKKQVTASTEIKSRSTYMKQGILSCFIYSLKDEHKSVMMTLKVNVSLTVSWCWPYLGVTHLSRNLRGQRTYHRNYSMFHVSWVTLKFNRNIPAMVSAYVMISMPWSNQPAH